MPTDHASDTPSLGESSNQGAHKGYGRACLQCRQKKRKCRPSETKPDLCLLCEKEGEECQLFSKRSGTHQAATSSSPPGDSARPAKRSRAKHANARTTAPTMAPNDSASSLIHPSLDLMPPPVPDAPPAFWSQMPVSQVRTVPPSLPSPSTHLLATSPLSQQLNQVMTPRSMNTGHGVTYTAAMSDLVARVCGGPSRIEVNEQLLQTYFVWQGPQHMPVDERLFRRDMAREPPGQFFSPLLLHAIHAQASRHILARDDGWVYADRANALLVASLAEPPSLTTIQALLILSGRDLALGQASASWLKSGMAFRMISDMGLEADAMSDLADCPLDRYEEVVMRQRVFWSAYSWDKFFALTLGRQPTFHLPPGAQVQPPLPSDNAPWQPFFADDTICTYPAQPSYAGDAFRALCLLNIEIELIIQGLYGKPQHSTSPRVADIDALRSRLLQWRFNVTPQILLDTSYLPPACPPPHILALNILYRTAWILLLRPLIRHDRSPSEARQICVDKSTEINHLFKLHDRTFGLRNITYNLAYMAYVSATVDIVEALASDTIRSTLASQRLELTLRVLTKAAHHTPGIQRSIHHLRQKLIPHPSRGQTVQQSGAATPTTAHPAGHLPTADQVAMALSIGSARQPELEPATNVFGDLPLGVSFDELFASLLPEYSMEANANSWNPFADGDSTAYLPMMDMNWDGMV